MAALLVKMEPTALMLKGSLLLFQVMFFVLPWERMGNSEPLQRCVEEVHRPTLAALEADFRQLRGL